MAVTLKSITEDNFIDAFNLKLKKDQEEFVSHPVRSLAQAYVISVSRLEFMMMIGWLDM